MQQNNFSWSDVGRNIKHLRELRGIKQDTVAIQLDLSQSAYSKIESGATQITLQRLTQIANVLNVRPEDILTFDANRALSNASSADETDDSLIAQLRAENAHLRAMIEKLIG